MRPADISPRAVGRDVDRRHEFGYPRRVKSDLQTARDGSNLSVMRQ
ncbi:hypothetical protein FF36_02428 [Frankia torreyi]|uniref:Uncharacterized protein n=1 Tax=Frankia torreyi TaxID=1856 RepID=A0A0D8BGQ6_9ACTN|nr:hypothetical protein FF36_02428 [Frankia torreyi]KQM06528.1 hypothetical protein FF86_1008111 [Frankia sp. CpI1-P]